MTDGQELPDAIYEEVKRHSERGNRRLEAKDADAAMSEWTKALSLLPEPHDRWEAAMWLHPSLGDARREKSDLSCALQHFRRTADSAGGETNAFVLVSLGATLYDLGQRDAATDLLLRAYMLAGEDLLKAYGGPYLGYLRQRQMLA